MAGHSKWANIQHRKKAQDAKRGKVFTRLIREITVAARTGGEDLNANARLRSAIDTAKAANMANDTITRAIKRGAGSLEGNDFIEASYEGYGPGGVAILVDCVTDNRNRTVADVRYAFSKYDGNLGAEGSVSYLFSKVGQLIFSSAIDEDAVMEIALEADAQDVITHKDGCIEVITRVDTFEDTKALFKAKKITPEYSEITQIASTQVDLDDETAEKVDKLLDALDNLDDVQNVYCNVS